MASNDRQAVGWVSGPLYYTPYFGDYWYTPGLTGTLQQTADEVRQTARRVNHVLDEPEHLTAGVVRGAIAGVTGRDTRPLPLLDGEDGGGEVDEDRGREDRELAVDADPPSLISRIQVLVTEGAYATTAVALESILANARTEDVELRDGALRALQQARAEGHSLSQTAREVWESLNSRHIVWGGVQLNAARSSSTLLREGRLEIERPGGAEEVGVGVPETDGTSPIRSLVRCQELYRTLREQHQLEPPPPAETQLPPTSASPPPSRRERSAPGLSQREREELIQRTDEAVGRFCEKTVHYSTMQAMRTLFSHDIEPNEFNRMIQDGGNLQAKYLRRAGGGRFKQFVYRHTYRVILKLVSPIINETVQGVTTHLREFLNDDVSVQKFTEDKIKDLARYYGRIERGRRDYLQTPDPTHPGYNAGDFEEFLQLTMRRYGENELTEAELTKLFGDYIVEMYTPRPAIEIHGYRIPIISGGLEWMVHGIRKALVRFFLRRTQIIDTILTQGTGSVHYAQLGLKRMLQGKLTEIIEMIQRSRPRTVSDLSDPRADSTRVQLEARKAQIITRQLHQVIEQHSRNLHRFIDIQACENDEVALRQLDGRISALTHELLGAVQALFQSEPFSLQRVLEKATTNMIETSLLSVLDDRERQIETQMLGIFEILDRAYDFTPPEDRWEQEQRYIEQLGEVDDNLNELLEQLSRIAIEASIEDHLKNASVDRHQQIVEFVDREKHDLTEFAQFLYSLDASVTEGIEGYDPGNPNIGEVKEQINQAIARIEGYLRRTAKTLRSKEFNECYSDTKGDLSNGYALMIHFLHQFAFEVLDPALQEIERIEQGERDFCRCEEAYHRLDNLSLDLLPEELNAELAAIAELLPETQRAALEEPLAAIRENWEALGRVNQDQRLFLDLGRAGVKIELLNGKLEQLEDIQLNLTELSDLVREYHDLRGPNRVYTTQNAVIERRRHLEEEVQRRYGDLMAIENPELHQYVLTLLRSDNTDLLYQKLHPSWQLRRQVPVFVALENYRALIQQDRERYLRQQRILSDATESLDSDEIGREKAPLAQAMRERVKAARNRTREQGFAIVASFMEDLRRLSERTKKFQETGWEMGVVAEEFKVSQFIAVGELKLAQNMDPVVATIAPKISEAITHLLDSLGKPFHYKQLVLRLVILDVVNRHEA